MSGCFAANSTLKPEADQRRRIKFSLQSYKYHSLGDYGDTIRQYGTTDSYSTKPVSNTIMYLSDIDMWLC